MGIGPSTKETTLHNFRDPLLDVVSADEDLDLMGILIVGTPQDQQDKEGMRADGVIISADGWGNSDVDYANTIEQLGKRDIPVVGIHFSGTAGQFVVTNPYMDTIVDMNKNPKGVETDVVGENAVDIMDARKATAMLKLKMRKR